MKHHLNTHQITIVSFHFMGIPCVKEQHDVDVGRTSERRRTSYRVDVGAVPGLRGALLGRMRKEANTIDGLLDLIEHERS